MLRNSLLKVVVYFSFFTLSFVYSAGAEEAKILDDRPMSGAGKFTNGVVPAQRGEIRQEMNDDRAGDRREGRMGRREERMDNEDGGIGRYGDENRDMRRGERSDGRGDNGRMGNENRHELREIRQMKEICRNDKEKFCVDKTGPEARKCMFENRENLSQDCKNAMRNVNDMRRGNESGERGTRGQDSDRD